VILQVVRQAPALPRNQSLQRAAGLLRVLAADRSGSTAMQLAAATRLPLATVRRLLATLADAGFAEVETATGRWVIGNELLRLGRAADPYTAVVAAARPQLERLAETTGEAALLGASRLPHSVDVICQVNPPRMVGIASWVGRAFGLHASAGARIALAARSDEEVRLMLGPEPYHRYAPRTIVDSATYLADLERVRREKVAVGADELEEGLTTIAVPVGDLHPDNRFAIGLSGPSFRFGSERRPQLVRALVRAARELEAGLRAGSDGPGGNRPR
jgi:DNA-binding IclR family transcriptional regulator